MSTRSHIIVTNGNTTHYVYHHCDGYLEGVGKELKDFTKKFVRSSYLKNPEVFCKELENWDDSYRFEDRGPHGDEEYIYTVKIYEDSSIEVSVLELQCTKLSTGWDEKWISVPEFTQTFTADISPFGTGTTTTSFEEGFEIIGWPDIQAYMDIEGFEENSALINQNDNIGIGSSTYLISRDWLKSL